LIPTETYPAYDSDFTYGSFSAFFSLHYLVLATAAYVQWYVFVPALRRRLRNRLSTEQ